LAFGIDTDSDEGPASGIIVSDASNDDKGGRSIPMRLKTEVPPVAHADDEVTLTDTRNRTRIVGGSGALSLFHRLFAKPTRHAVSRAKQPLTSC
jgi:hypothetical protein